MMPPPPMPNRPARSPVTTAPATIRAMSHKSSPRGTPNAIAQPNVRAHDLSRHVCSSLPRVRGWSLVGTTADLHDLEELAQPQKGEAHRTAACLQQMRSD